MGGEGLRKEMGSLIRAIIEALVMIAGVVVIMVVLKGVSVFLLRA